MNVKHVVEEIIVKHEKVTKLQDAIRECPTFSRLHFLMGIVDSGIKWEKSAENAVSTTYLLTIAKPLINQLVRYLIEFKCHTKCCIVNY